MIEIELTGGVKCLVDDADFDKVRRWKWQAKQSRNTQYAVRSGWSGGEKIFVMMHCFILGVGPSVIVDHRNGNGLDNRRENLRVATNQQNCFNRRPLPGTSSRFKGVDFYKRNGKWRARIKRDGRLRHLGTFDSEEEAARRYDQEARILFGEFARTNF